MRTPMWYDHAIIRLVPRPEREEFINVGVIVSCASARFLAARIFIDEVRLGAFCPALDLEATRSHLEAIPRICAGGAHAGPLGALTQRERFHWLVAPRSAAIQTSAVHTGWCKDPEAAIDHLVRAMVETVDRRA